MPNIINMTIKQFLSKVSVDDDERTVTAVISTTGVDRDKEVLLSKGANLEKYLKNPIVLWAHSYHETPIGKSQWITKSRNKLQAKVEFVGEGISAKADEIYNMFKGGFLNAFSVGFIPIKMHEPTPDEIRKNPEWADARLVYDEWELLEFSAVPVPANPAALALAVKTKELALSDETKNEIEIEWDDDDETTYVPDANKTAPTDEVVVENENEESESVRAEPLVKVERIVKAKPQVRARPHKSFVTKESVGKITCECIKQVKGIMY